jgi:hypothetical protein
VGRLTRFLNLERPRPSSEESLPPLNAARFEPRPEIELQRDDGEQPFVRCPHCEADNGKFAVTCLNCNARLDTPEVRVWNEQFWAARQAQAASDAQAEQERQRQLAADQRAMGEAIAQEVGERERQRLGDSTPLGWRFLADLPENERLPTLIGVAALFVLNGAMAMGLRGHPLLQLLGGGVAIALLVLFAPLNRPR